MTTTVIPWATRCLRNVSRVISAAVRATDFVARFGGEEIAVILTQTPLLGAVDVAERLRAEIEATAHDYQGKALFKTASFGLAAYDGSGESIKPEGLLARADQALYAAKHGGRNCVVTWHPGLAPTG